MAYKFKQDDRLDKGFRRIAREQSARALNEIGQKGVSDQGVHEIRKTMKRLRALLRLIRPQIGEQAFKASNSGLRDAGLMLSRQRESRVLTETVIKLEGHLGDGAVAILAPFKMAIEKAAREAPTTLAPAAADALRTRLEREGRRLGKLKLKGEGFEVVAAGLEQSYDKGRRRLVKAYKSPSHEAFHDLRKTVQWHWRHMTLLSRAWPEYFEVRIQAARELSQLLGDDHDLAVLQNAAKAMSKAGTEDFSAVIRLARAAQEELRGECHERARRIFAEPADDFVRRLAIYWQSGQRATPVRGAIDNDSAHQEPELEPGPEQKSKTDSVPRLIPTRDNVPSRKRA